MAILSKVLTELEAIVEQRAAIAMAAQGLSGGRPYAAAVDHQVDVLGRVLRILMERADPQKTPPKPVERTSTQKMVQGA
jgi:hypothetical protein